VLYCPPDAGPDYGEDVEDGPTKYGYQKSGCELAVTNSFGTANCTILRPGVVLGPREYVGRLPWWLGRVARGGRVLAPGNPSRHIQPIEVCDLANFVLRAINESIAGTYNVAAPQDRETFGDLLCARAAATGSDPEFIWIRDEELLAAGLRQWSQLPLWRTFPGVWQVDARAAHTRGLSCRALTETAADTWAWMRSDRIEFNDQRAGEIGISPDLERRILSRLTGI
jgi:nucleoside-diphosphate-sugar epimerase